MDCLEVLQQLKDYLDGTLPAFERERILSHLDRCEDCLNYVHDIRKGTWET